ncbi:MAG: hypothetical protein V4693_02050 [Pseudomonadota bacterium]
MNTDLDQLTRPRLFQLLNSLLDAETKQEYGEDALLICASALGITTSSTMMFDDMGHVILQLAPAEVRRRLEFVTQMKAQRHVSFHRAMRRYFESNPQPDPLAKLERMLASKAPRVGFSKKPKGPSFTG